MKKTLLTLGAAICAIIVIASCGGNEKKNDPNLNQTEKTMDFLELTKQRYSERYFDSTRVVEKDGRVTNGKVKVPLFPDCDVEAMRVVMSLPNWKPGKNMGQPVRCYYQVPITFRL